MFTHECVLCPSLVPTHVHICGCLKLMLSVFLNHSPPYFLRRGLLLNPELAGLVRLASSKVQAFPCWSLPRAGWQARAWIFMGAGDQAQLFILAVRTFSDRAVPQSPGFIFLCSSFLQLHHMPLDSVNFCCCCSFPALKCNLLESKFFFSSLWS